MPRAHCIRLINDVNLVKSYKTIAISKSHSQNNANSWQAIKNFATSDEYHYMNPALHDQSFIGAHMYFHNNINLFYKSASLSMIC